MTRGRRVGVAFGVLMSLVLIALAGGYLYLRSIGVYGASDPGEPVSITIPKGATFAEVGAILVDQGVIESELGWRIANYLDGGGDEIQAGEYELLTGLSARDALAALLESGPAGEEFVVVTFQEGLWLTEFAATLAAATDLSEEKFLDLVTTGKVRSSLQPEGVDTLEGLLFPSTYQIAVSDTERKVARRLVQEMEDQVAALDLSYAKSVNLTPYDIVNIASMIEAETRVDSERPMVARVIYNRLSQGIPLGIDATYLYALGERKDFLTESDLAIDSPYNLRQNLGLPPTPIGAPGAASLEAAANPAEGDWLFYVLADCEGNHAFSETNDEFLQDKAHYQTLDC